MVGFIATTLLMYINDSILFPLLIISWAFLFHFYKFESLTYPSLLSDNIMPRTYNVIALKQ